MKTGIGTNAYFDDINVNESAEGFFKMKVHGYDCADYQRLVNINNSFYAMNESEFEKFILREKEHADRAGIEIFQVHGPCSLDDSTPEIRHRKLECMRRAINATALIGSKYIVVHPVMPYGWGPEEDPSFAYGLNLEMCSKLLEYAEEFGITICIENMPTVKLGLSRIPALVKFVDGFNRENFAICLDTGHANVCGDSPAEMVKLCGDRLKTLHVHDSTADKGDHLFPFRGNIDWDLFKKSLKGIGFDGCISLETRVRGNYPEEIKNHFLMGLGKIAKVLASD
jgi:L-ribulose-5-phosphate 3-epimerase